MTGLQLDQLARLLPPVLSEAAGSLGGSLMFTCDGSSLKAKALTRDPRAAICVDDQAPPYSFVEVRGPARWYLETKGRRMGHLLGELQERVLFLIRDGDDDKPSIAVGGI